MKSNSTRRVEEPKFYTLAYALKQANPHALAAKEVAKNYANWYILKRIIYHAVKILLTTTICLVLLFRNHETLSIRVQENCAINYAQIVCLKTDSIQKIPRLHMHTKCKRSQKMDEYLKEALEIVKAQASVRTMTEEEITSMVQKIATGIKAIAEGGSVETEEEASVDPKKAIREKSILCCACGKSFKVLTKKHLSSHDLTPDEYREKYGYKKKLPLVCKSLQRERRKKMKEMKLWTRRGNTNLNRAEGSH